MLIESSDLRALKGKTIGREEFYKSECLEPRTPEYHLPTLF